MSHIPVSAVPHAKPHDDPEQEPQEANAAPQADTLATMPPADDVTAGGPPQADAAPTPDAAPESEPVPAEGPGKRPGPGAGPIIVIASIAAVGVGGIIAALALRRGEDSKPKGGKKTKRGGRKSEA